MNLTPKTKVKFLGREWNWEYSMQTMFDFDQLTGKPFIVMSFGDFTSRDWLVLLYAGLCNKDPKYTFEQYLNELQAVMPQMEGVRTSISTIWDLLFSVSQKDDGNPNPQ